MSTPRALIHGQKLYRDMTWNFSFWRPLKWHQAQLIEPHGVVIYPEEDPRTGFYVTMADLDDIEEEIAATDLPAIRGGLIEGLRALDDCQILAEKEIEKEKAIGFEFVLTFSRDGAPYKQKLRMLYRGKRQISIYGQATPPEDFAVFENIYDYMYLTFTFGDLLLDMGVPPMPGMETHYIPPDQ